MSTIKYSVSRNSTKCYVIKVYTGDELAERVTLVRRVLVSVTRDEAMAAARAAAKACRERMGQ